MSGPADVSGPAEAAAEVAGEVAGVPVDAVKLTSYFGERQRVGGTPGGASEFAADALLDLYGRHQLATSILLRGAEGFGARQRLRTDRSLSLSEDLPLVTVAVDTKARISEVLEPARGLISSGLVTLERARLLSGDIPALTLKEGPGEETKLTIYLGRQERVYRVPAFMAVCDLLHRRGIAGATALLGVDGTARGERNRAAFFSRNTGTPMMVIAVGSGARIGRVLPELGALLRRPLLTLERVRICKRDGSLLWAPSALPGTDESGMPLWHKLMIYTSEAALHDGQPIHRAIVRRLRAAGVAGATTLRGVWGFHGDHAPHGDRLLQLGRHVPVITVVIDEPRRIAAAFDIIDSLTAAQGLVTSEIVPALRLAGTDGRAGATIAGPLPPLAGASMPGRRGLVRDGGYPGDTVSEAWRLAEREVQACRQAAAPGRTTVTEHSDLDAEIFSTDLPEGAYLLDVREDDEWAAGHAPEAVHVRLGELSARAAEIPQDQEVYVICRSGARSAYAAQALAGAGWSTTNVADGMTGWAVAGKPMVSETGAEPFVA